MYFNVILTKDISLYVSIINILICNKIKFVLITSKNLYNNKIIKSIFLFFTILAIHLSEIKYT